MTKRELIRYLHRGYPVDVDVREVENLTGLVRKVVFYPDGPRKDYSVTVEYEAIPIYLSGDFEGAHLKYGAFYKDLDKAIEDVESLLERPIDEWKNYTAELLPVEPVDCDTQCLLCLETLRQQGDLQLPNGAVLELFGSVDGAGS